MPTFASPLRYPGGKAGLTALLKRVIELNALQDCVYAEPYAGGAGAALSLLYSERVSRIMINDADPHIAAFWQSVIDRPGQFASLIEDTPVTIDEWHNQRSIYNRPASSSRIKLGFATFYLNRCNRSGIIDSGGPIGGFEQAGKWKLDARFNRPELISRIDKVAAFKERIEVSNLDALVFLSEKVLPVARKIPLFTYLDPPYYVKGQKLYLNHYQPEDHRKVANYLKRIRRFQWLVSYDNVPEIAAMYDGLEVTPFDLTYTAYQRRLGSEILIRRRGFKVPDDPSSWVAGRQAA